MCRLALSIRRGTCRFTWRTLKREEIRFPLNCVTSRFFGYSFGLKRGSLTISLLDKEPLVEKKIPLTETILWQREQVAFVRSNRSKEITRLRLNLYRHRKAWKTISRKTFGVESSPLNENNNSVRGMQTSILTLLTLIKVNFFIYLISFSTFFSSIIKKERRKKRVRDARFKGIRTRVRIYALCI